ncbi:ATP-binding protein [Zongyangia hominis]|uniref:Circadian input-output histidine kinase CikA n=1 Tax=Zongyangia hominis TaxID=2763677 RepID=A0A926EE85_9FIRM|nr:transporter substrate-binding domain-containing protein [Zongyangia hominis]MBC8570486.1 transporter substrate-binding domain-containing protein [Zongyangia hominis]
MKYFSRNMRFCAVFLIAVLLTALMIPCAAQAEEKVLRVAYPDAEGYTMTTPDGHRYGLVVDFLNEIAKYTGWKYEYVDTNSTNLLDQFFSGDFDLMGGNYYAEGYEEYFAYPDFNCGYSKIVLLTRRDDDRIKSYDLSTFNGKTIGVFERATENIRRLKEYLSSNDLDCTIKTYTFEDLSITGDLFPFLENGEVDMLVGNSKDSESGFNVAATIESQAHYIVTTPGNQEVLDGLNMALEKIYQANPNFASEVYAANFSTIGSGHIVLSRQEQGYVRQKGTVTVAVPNNWHPIFCLDNEDQHDGLVPDFLKEVANYAGLQFSYLYCDNYAESISKVQSGEADMLGFFVGTEEDAMERGLALTSSYTKMDSILVRNKESTYPAEGLVGAVLEGCELPSNIVADEVKHYLTVAEALSDVNKGKVDFFYGISSHLEYIMQQQHFPNVVQVNLVNDSTDIGFAMGVPVDPDLFTIVNKAINNMTEEQRDTISSRNLVSIGESRMTLTGIIYANPELAISVVSVFLLLILATVILIFRARLHTAAMQNELEKAEAESRAKSEFLSRMSHEIRTPMNAIVGLTDLTGMMEGLPEKAQGNLAKIKSSSHYLLGLINDILDMSRIENGKMDLSRESFSLGLLLDELQNMMKAEAQERNLNFRVEKQIQNDVVLGDPVRLRQVFLNLLSNAFKFTPPGGTVRILAREDASTPEEATFTFRVADTGVGISEEDHERIFLSFEQVGPNITKSQGTGLGLAISKNIVQLMGGELLLQSRTNEGSEFYFTVTFPKGRNFAQMAQPAACTKKDRLQGLSILLAEDNLLNAEIAKELLTLQGAQVTHAENGKQAVALMKESRPGTYQIILMDILMPEMNGLEATQAIRSLRPDTASIPILAMTANTFKEDVDAALAAGMTGFIPKPIDVNYLYNAIEQARKDRVKP